VKRLLSLAAAAALSIPFTVVTQPAGAASPCPILPYGDIGAEWNRLGGAASKLGCPTGSERDGSRAGTRVQNFAHGEISWSPSFSPHMTLVGYVVPGELHLVWNHVTDPYDNMSLFVTTSRTDIRHVAYSQLGEASVPLSSSASVFLAACAAGRSSGFEGLHLGLMILAPKGCRAGAAGSYLTEAVGPLSTQIAWAPPPPAPPAPPPAATQNLPDKIILKFGKTDNDEGSNIVFTRGCVGGCAIGGWAYADFYRNGNVVFIGHFHDSGGVSYDYNFSGAVVASDGTVFTFSRRGHVAGTDEAGSRDSDWTVSKNDPRVTAHWAALVHHSQQHEAFIGGNQTDAFNSLVDDVKKAAEAAGAVSAIIAVF
jgi:hypothetical protein